MNWILPTTELFILQKLFSSPESRNFLYDPEHLVKSSECKSFEVYRHRNMILTELRKGPFFLISLSRETFIANIPVKHRFAVVEFLNIRNGGDFKTELYHCVLNTDQTFRFAFPARSQHPSFLNLYNGSGLRKLIISSLIKLAFACNRKGWISKGTFSLIYQGEHPLKPIVSSVDDANYSIFSGTKGANRKVVIEMNDQGKTSGFIKIPMTEEAENLIENENKTIKALMHLSVQHAKFPTVKKLSKGLQLSNVKPESYYNKTKLVPLHLKCLAELYQLRARPSKIGELSSYHFIGKQLSELDIVNSEYCSLDQSKLSTLVKNLKAWYNTIPVENKINVSLTHGDFTPWNMYLTPKAVHLYDWELAREDLPLLYDAFHFIFQSATLIGNNPISKIWNDLSQLKKTKIIQNLLDKYQIDFDLNWKYYLLFTISYYLPLYIKQNDLHSQAHWLLRNWHDAITLEGFQQKSKPEPQPLNSSVRL